MKKTITFCVLAAGITCLYSFAPKAEAGDCGGSGTGPRKSAGPPSCYSGEPPLRATCASAGCHESSALNSGTALLQLDLNGAENGYVLGKTYDIKVTLSKAGLVRGGFQLIALQDNDENTTPGMVTLTDVVRTQLIDPAHPHAGNCASANKVWVEHTIDGIDDVQNSDSLVWHVNWTAPSVGVGNITFYVASVDANKDLDNTGDHVYSLQKKSTGTVGIAGVSMLQQLLLYPNPAQDIIYFNLPDNINKKEGDGVVIMNTLGQVVLQAELTKNLVVSLLQSGSYFITITMDGKRKTLPFLKH